MQPKASCFPASGALFIDQRFPNWWVAKSFSNVIFFNYTKIKNHKKWESEKTKQN
jgi:hypothetical protein